jgi:hypothetical protein
MLNALVANAGCNVGYGSGPTNSAYPRHVCLTPDSVQNNGHSRTWAGAKPVTVHPRQCRLLRSQSGAYRTSSGHGRTVDPDPKRTCAARDFRSANRPRTPIAAMVAFMTAPSPRLCSFRERLHDLAGTIDKTLRDGANGSIFDRDNSDGSGLYPQFDRQSLQPQGLAAELHG